MRIGIPRELKDNEYRVGMTPGGCRSLVDAGHAVFVEASAGDGSGFSDQEFIQAGATVLPNADEVFGQCEMIIKVKEPIEPEYERLREGQILFTYLHLAPLPTLTGTLCERKVTGIAYETITDRHGGLPLLAPMSEVAGRMSVLVGATYLQKAHGGCGVLVSGVPGVPASHVVIIGGGIVGLNALKIAHGMRARVTVLEQNPDRMRFIDDLFEGSVSTVYSNKHNLEEAISSADMVVGAVLIPGRSAPKLVTREMLGLMKPGSVLVDVAVDQGGCFETTKPTTHSDPVYEVDGILHYCVANMPGAVPRTSTLALTNSTLPFALAIANKGAEKALLDDTHLMQGVNTYAGHITCQPVAESQEAPYRDPRELIG
ncbi:MAG: alanine dehydrogenase [Thermoanaerobaculia bacterium]|nr:alanine dehydrogenase [Thermoanaerobaculia bacterium]